MRYVADSTAQGTIDSTSPANYRATLTRVSLTQPLPSTLISRQVSSGDGLSLQCAIVVRWKREDLIALYLPPTYTSALVLMYLMLLQLSKNLNNQLLSCYSFLSQPNQLSLVMQVQGAEYAGRPRRDSRNALEKVVAHLGCLNVTPARQCFA